MKSKGTVTHARRCLAYLFLIVILWLPCVANSEEQGGVVGHGTVEEGGRIHSMGQPSKWEFYAVPMLSHDGDEDAWGGHLTGGLYRYLKNPNFGIGFMGEGYVGGIDGETDSGVRAMAGLKMFFLHGGIDYSFRKEELDGIISLAFPLKRGGLFGRGGGFQDRLDPWPKQLLQYRDQLPVGPAL